MELNEYQKQAMTTCMDTCDNYSYMVENLVGEVGEFASKVAKQIRKGNLITLDNELCTMGGTPVRKLTDAELEGIKVELKKEAGDILWQLSGLCHVMGWNLEDVAQMNLDKLASRKKRGVIDGNGDNR